MRIRVLTLALVLVASVAYADPLSCNLTGYKASPGLTAAVADDVLAVTWNGDRESEVRLRFGLDRGAPIIRELAVRRKGGTWATLASNVSTEFRVVSGVRRMTGQQLGPLRVLGVPITQEVIDREKWNAFWDAPLDLPGTEEGRPPRAEGLPRKPEEIVRATATYQSQGCEVKTNGGRLEITFPGVTLGVFAGRLQYSIYRGTNLIRQEVIAKTDQPSVAYKYDAGLKGLAIQDGSRVVWRDTANQWQENRLGGMKNDREVALRTSARIVLAENKAGSISAFPPPHTFFWAREAEDNLGYSWYRKDSETTFSFGIRQAEREDKLEYQANFALYSAPPGTWQRMGSYLYVSPEPAQTAIQASLDFTHSDRYKVVPGYQTLAHHYHTKIAERLMAANNPDLMLPDLDAIRGAGITIASPADFHGDANPWDPGPLRLKAQAAYFDAIRRFSDSNFLIMPDEEVDCGSGGPEAARNRPNPCPPDAYLGAHWDVLYSKPTFWTRVRAPGQPFVEQHPTYGTVYHVGSSEDVMEMIRRSNSLIFMAHPRTKGSTGYPDAVKDTAAFKDENYRGIGWRWGMGLDLSETHLSEKRATLLLDDMNNWVADLPTPPKYILAITETRFKRPGDDVYGMSPINYVKVDPLPKPDDMSSVVNAIKRGDFFVSTGEVLIPTYAVEGTGAQRTITAEVEWTFPLDFVEVVWGDGAKIERQVISATDLPPFGKKRFQIPFNATGKKWVRFAAWDSAGNGAMVQPVKLTPAPSTSAAR